MSVTSINSRAGMSDAEWRTRCDLAACYRLLHHYKMTDLIYTCLLYTSPSPRDATLSRMPSSA